MSVKDKSPKKRIEYRGKNIRVSRTGGVSATKTVTKDGYGATINTNHGLRLHKRLFKGARMGFQNSNFQFIGRYNSGPLNFNISKTGVSTSVKNKRGAYNLLKPNYSSFKLAGVQVRGKNAATLQSIFMSFTLVVNLVKFMWHITISILWMFFLMLKWVVDFIIGFYKGYKINNSQ
jgi:hypothetical protein